MKSSSSTLFTEQYKHGKKPLESQNNIKRDKSEKIKDWLEYLSQQITMNEGGRYNVIYEIAKEECAKQNNAITLERYYTWSRFPSKIFSSLPNLSIQEIAQEAERNPIEITMTSNKDNPFYGCRLKAKPLYEYPNDFRPSDHVNPSNLIMRSIIAAPFALVDNALQEKKLAGFIVELDPSPKPQPNHGCKIS